MSHLPNLKLPASPSPGEQLQLLKDFLRQGNELLKEQHLAGQSGLVNCRNRSHFIDDLLKTLFQRASKETGHLDIALAAHGGYGRAYLNPGSDLDILFITTKPGHKITKPQREFIDRILYPLWDLNFTVGHACRSISESLEEGKRDPITRTTLFDCRFLAGNPSLFDNFQDRIRRDLIEKPLNTFLEERRLDLKTRGDKYGNTVFLQEPNLKESPGGLRDYHNLIWVTDALYQTRDLEDLHKKDILSQNALRETQDAFEFLLRLRNDLHYREGKEADILTLRRQGPIADFFGYPQNNLLQRIEELMRDYYTCARDLRQHTETLFEEAELNRSASKRLFFQTSVSVKPDRQFDDFHARDKRLFANDPEVFTRKPQNLLHLFYLCQKFDLSPSPTLRRQIVANLTLIDKDFRYAKEPRDIFQSILSNKGKVGRTLRLMHRVKVLGTFLPEFDQLTCLVQHEFFHRYTADEHTLRCIDQLDALVDSNKKEEEHYRQLLIQHEDPYAIYLALIMHDTGRSEDVAEHTDGSAMLTDQVCKRLRIKSERRKLIMFLVDHHLSLFRFATKRDLSDQDTITEFASLMKNKHYLDSLFVFTYADSKGTNEEASSSWKEALQHQLYSATRRFLVEGQAEYDRIFREELADTKRRVIRRLQEPYQHLVENHFEQMPKRYFRFRGSRSIRHHIRSIGQYQNRCKRRPNTPFECAVRWLSHPEAGYSELIVAAEDKPGLLRRIACALAAHEINILSADAYTRQDGLSLDLFRVTTSNLEAVTSEMQQLSFVTTLYEISSNQTYNPDDYLIRPRNYLDEKKITEFTVPVRAMIRNDLDPNFTVLEIQAVDRAALLYDTLATLDFHQHTITHARICTEKGVALDSLYLLNKEGEKLTPEEQESLLHDLEPALEAK